MSPQLTVGYMIVQAQRERLPARAKHAMRVAEAGVAAPGARLTPLLRRALGRRLVALGERPHGAPPLVASDGLSLPRAGGRPI